VRSGSECFDDFVNRFNPLNRESYALIEALLLTLLWGGPPGGRPLFVITGPRGSGKSTLVSPIARLVGGWAQINMGNGRSFSEPIGEQALSDTNLTKRVILLDNAEGYLRSPRSTAPITQ